MKPILLNSIFVLSIFFLSHEASGHADYEFLASELNADNGSKLNLFRHYTDGIFFGDPVKVILKSESRDLDETKYSGEVSIHKIGSHVWIFTYSHPGIHPLAHKIYTLNGKHLEAQSPGWLKILSPIALVWGNALKYFVLMIPMLIGFWFIQKTRHQKGVWALVNLGMYVFLIPLILFYALFLMVGDTSPIMTLLLAIGSLQLLKRIKWTRKWAS